MPTSDRKLHLLTAEAAVAGALAATAAALVPGADPWLPGVAPHPAWIAVAVLAAFYGMRGLLVAAPLAWTAVALASAALGGSLVPARGDVAGDALSLTACLLIAAVGSLHRRRIADAEAQLRSAERFAEEDARALEELEQVALTFRARGQRIDSSIRFWRDIAERLENGSQLEAAQAALELCMVRTGARAGLVRRCEGEALYNVAWRGRWTESNPIPRDIFTDKCISAALQRGRVVLAEDVPGAGAEDADVAVPVTAPDGSIVGVLALRGLPRHQLRDGDLSDVAQTAHWLARALRPENRTPTAQAEGSGSGTLVLPPLRATTDGHLSWD
jgi:hypothetical protein